MRNDRLGLSMIAATLAVIATILAALFVHQQRNHERQIRAQGVALSRSLASLPADRLIGRADPQRPMLLQALIGVHRSADFAYALVVGPAGERLGEVAAPGILVPQAALPSEPAGWYGEQRLASPDDGSAIVEFRAPVLAADGALAGFVRIGYRAGGGFDTEQISFAALLALPVFLLTPLTFFLMRRETQPLADLGRQLQTLAATADVPAQASPPAPARIDDFALQVGRLLQTIETRVGTLEAERFESVASNRMLSYKQTRIEAVLHALPEGVLILDAAGTPTFANVKVEPLLGTTVDHVVGQRPAQWCGGNDELVAFFDAARGARQPVEAAAEPAPERHLALSATPLFSPQDPSTLSGTLVVMRDVSQERLVKDAGAAFVANVSHELKTPLNTIASYSELLMDDQGLTDELRIEAVNVIRDETERMATLINNMLNISKLETGAMALDAQRVNVRDLLRDSFESLRAHAVGRGLDFRIEVPPNIGLAALDKGLMRIALNNLLSNAIKYNRPGGHVTLAAEESDDGCIQVFVRDAGIGIPPEQIGRVFEKYYRVGGEAASKASGHGLGLFLVKQIVDLHQGRITVDSEPGVGTEFCIALRKQAAAYTEAVAA